MAGYDGYSMSNNARYAYSNGEMPISKWTKQAFAEAMEDEGFENAQAFLSYPVAFLKEYLLTNSSWHHTSKHYNKTEFYMLDEDRSEDSAEEIAEEFGHFKIREANDKLRKQAISEHKQGTATYAHHIDSGDKEYPIVGIIVGDKVVSRYSVSDIEKWEKSTDEWRTYDRQHTFMG